MEIVRSVVLKTLRQLSIVIVHPLQMVAFYMVAPIVMMNALVQNFCLFPTSLSVGTFKVNVIYRAGYPVVGRMVD